MPLGLCTLRGAGVLLTHILWFRPCSLCADAVSALWRARWCDPRAPGRACGRSLCPRDPEMCREGRFQNVMGTTTEQAHPPCVPGGPHSLGVPREQLPAPPPPRAQLRAHRQQAN